MIDIERRPRINFSMIQWSNDLRYVLTFDRHGTQATCTPNWFQRGVRNNFVAAIENAKRPQPNLSWGSDNKRHSQTIT